MDSWLYSPPNANGTCRKPDRQMLIANNAPGTCFVDTPYPPYTCKQPDPLDSGAPWFCKQSNKDYAICRLLVIIQQVVQTRPPILVQERTFRDSVLVLLLQI